MIDTITDDAPSFAADIRPFRKAIRTLEREIEKALAVQTDCCGVSSAQCHLLLEIAETGTGSVSDLAQRLDLDISTLSRGVDSLVRTGLATREVDATNRRRQLVALSAEGQDKARAINETCDAYYLTLLNSLPAELQKATVHAVPLLAMAMRQARKAVGESSCQCGSGEVQP